MSTLGHLDKVFDSCKSCSDITEQDRKRFVKKKEKLAQLYQKWQTIFSWQDGPLVQAMKNGDLFLVDEISLADDSVLERLNSVLEPERKLVGSFKELLVKYCIELVLFYSMVVIVLIKVFV